MFKTNEEIKNCLSSELLNMIYEFRSGDLTEELIYCYFSDFLIDANVNSKIVVDVLERKQFGDFGKDQARCIKINEGW
jgi:hypothetical protein